MADIAAGDVTYTDRGLAKRVGKLTHTKTRVQFGNATLTYPAAGVPLTLAKLGFKTQVESVVVNVNATSTQSLWVWNGNTTAPTLLGLEVDATAAGDTGLINLDGSDTPAAQDLELTCLGY